MMVDTCFTALKQESEGVMFDVSYGRADEVSLKPEFVLQTFLKCLYEYWFCLQLISYYSKVVKLWL